MTPSTAYLCSECSNGLPVWQQTILSVVGLAIAFAVLWGLYRLFTLWSNRHDSRPK